MLPRRFCCLPGLALDKVGAAEEVGCVTRHNQFGFVGSCRSLYLRNFLASSYPCADFIRPGVMQVNNP